MTSTPVQTASSYLTVGPRLPSIRMDGNMQPSHAFDALQSYEITEPPLRLRQQTCQELRVAGTALADTPTLYRWEKVEGQLALRHVVPSCELQIMIQAGKALKEWGLPNTYEALSEEVKQLGINSVFLMQFAIGITLQQDRGEATMSLDQFIELLGKKDDARKCPQKRRNWQQWTWRALRLLSNMSIVGTRKGVYKDANHKALVMTRYADDYLITIVEPNWDILAAIDNIAIPPTVHYACARWLQCHHSNRQVLPDFGNLRLLARIPSGKTTGSWARSIGLSLNQKWRELATYSEIDDKKRSVRLINRAGNRHVFTRQALLTGNNSFRATPAAEKILESKNPKRMMDYWDGAIQMLKDEGIIGRYDEVERLPIPTKDRAQSWLNQPLDIQPSIESIADMYEIARRRKTLLSALQPGKKR